MFRLHLMIWMRPALKKSNNGSVTANSVMHNSSCIDLLEFHPLMTPRAQQHPPRVPTLLALLTNNYTLHYSSSVSTFHTYLLVDSTALTQSSSLSHRFLATCICKVSTVSLWSHCFWSFCELFSFHSQDLWKYVIFTSFFSFLSLISSSLCRWCWSIWPPRYIWWPVSLSEIS